ncbi:MAG: hypothetical protein WC664_00800 [Patescibacteria group bacterium]|jgi:hypothetical protein
MSLIDDVIKGRFSRGNKFYGTGNKAGSFNRALSDSVVKNPSLKSLKDNKQALSAVAKKYEEYIRSNEVTSGMAEKMLREVKKNDQNLTSSDIQVIERLFRHFSKVGASKAVAIKKPSKAEQRSAAIKEEIKPSPVRELPDFLTNRGSVSIKKNPWSSPDTQAGGSGGGIAAGANQGRTIRKPTLLK